MARPSWAEGSIDTPAIQADTIYRPNIHVQHCSSNIIPYFNALARGRPIRGRQLIELRRLVGSAVGALARTRNDPRDGFPP